MGFKRGSDVAPAVDSMRHLVLLLGQYDSGKSMFILSVARYLSDRTGKKNFVIIDSDGKWGEALAVIRHEHLAGLIDPENVLLLDVPDITDTAAIRDELDKSMPSVLDTVCGIAVDTVTPILQPLIAKAIDDNSKGINKNKSSAFAEKANAMKILLSALNKWQLPVIYAAHYENSVFNGKRTARPTITKAELDRLGKYQNMTITLGRDGARRFARVDSVGIRPEYKPGSIVVDDTAGWWDGVFAKIVDAVYSIPDEEAARIESDSPKFFASREAAVQWMMKQKDKDGRAVFNAVRHAENTYLMVREWVIGENGARWKSESVGREAQMTTMATYLKREVDARKEGGSVVPDQYRKTKKMVVT